MQTRSALPMARDLLDIAHKGTKDVEYGKLADSLLQVSEPGELEEGHPLADFRVVGRISRSRRLHRASWSSKIISWSCQRLAGCDCSSGPTRLT